MALLPVVAEVGVAAQSPLNIMFLLSLVTSTHMMSGLEQTQTTLQPLVSGISPKSTHQVVIQLQTYMVHLVVIQACVLVMLLTRADKAGRLPKMALVMSLVVVVVQVRGFQTMEREAQVQAAVLGLTVVVLEVMAELSQPMEPVAHPTVVVEVVQGWVDSIPQISVLVTMATSLSCINSGEYQ